MRGTLAPSVRKPLSRPGRGNIRPDGRGCQQPFLDLVSLRETQSPITDEGMEALFVVRDGVGDVFN